MAGKTDTPAKKYRSKWTRIAVEGASYSCKKTDFDTSFPYQLLDAWAKFPDFQVRLANSIAQRQGLDRIMIGFNGISAAAATDRATKPRASVRWHWARAVIKASNRSCAKAWSDYRWPSRTCRFCPKNTSTCAALATTTDLKKEHKNAAQPDTRQAANLAPARHDQGAWRATRNARHQRPQLR